MEKILALLRSWMEEEQPDTAAKDAKPQEAIQHGIIRAPSK